MAILTLARQGSPLALASRQLQILQQRSDHPAFDSTIERECGQPLIARALEIIQINIGKLCNQTCHHCHVDAGPDRRENMDESTVRTCLRVIEQHNIKTLDITGGAPEMNPHFKMLVREARRLGTHVIDRCNLTILGAPGFEDVAPFLSDNDVEVVASLPCYLEENTDAQRGDGVFRKSIDSLKKLNALGYGTGDHTLTLVFNPVGPKLPPNQTDLETAYRSELRVRYGVEFSRLFTITNMPISRFLDDLLRTGHYDSYMSELVEAFNPSTVPGLMCCNTLSVSWDGRLFDCDFNQMLELGLDGSLPQTIQELENATLAGRRISTGQHCYGCTAGAGSGCQGAIS